MSEYLSTLWISLLCCVCLQDFYKLKIFVLIPIVKQNTNSLKKKKSGMSEEREWVSEWGAEKWRRRMKKIHRTQKLPLPLYTVARSHLLYTRFQKKRKEVKELELLLFNRYHRMKKGANENDINVCLYWRASIGMNIFHVYNSSSFSSSRFDFIFSFCFRGGAIAVQLYIFRGARHNRVTFYEGDAVCQEIFSFHSKHSRSREILCCSTNKHK